MGSPCSRAPLGSEWDPLLQNSIGIPFPWRSLGSPGPGEIPAGKAELEQAERAKSQTLETHGLGMGREKGGSFWGGIWDFPPGWRDGARQDRWDGDQCSRGQEP